MQPSGNSDHLPLTLRPPAVTGKWEENSNILLAYQFTLFSITVSLLIHGSKLISYEDFKAALKLNVGLM